MGGLPDKINYPILFRGGQALDFLDNFHRCHAAIVREGPFCHKSSRRTA
jgi:hypothetical protein